MTSGWPFYPADYERDTKRLHGATAHGCYFLLLKHYWTHGSLPNDDRELRTIVDVPPPQWKKLKPLMQSFFYDGWKHKRIERDLKKAGRFRVKQSERARARWQNKSVGDCGDKNSAEAVSLKHSHNAEKAFENKRPSMPVAYQNDAGGNANTKPKDRLPSIAARESLPVDKSGQPKKADASFSQHKLSKQQEAQAAWETDLRHTLKGEDYAHAIERLSDNPKLLERATQAEMRKPGSGALVAMIGLHRGVLP